ncbi:MAG: Ig-like domain-containing protein [Emcibacteraceae bacterium]
MSDSDQKQSLSTTVSDTVSADTISQKAKNKKLKQAGILMSLLPLAACGGSSGSKAPPPDDTPDPAPPAPTPTPDFTENPTNVFIAVDSSDSVLSKASATADLTVTGKGGNDTISTGSGDDIVDGGSGNDIISTGAGDDIVKGGPGNDTISTGTGADKIRGGNGIDAINAGADNDAIVVVGTTTANQYALADITNPAGSGTDLSALISLADLNGRGVSEVGSGETIDGGTGTNTLFIYGTVDLTGVTLTNVTVLIVNSDVTLTAAQMAQFTTVDGDGSSVINIEVPPGDTYIIDLSSLNITDIGNLNIDGDVTFIIDDATDLAEIGAINTGSTADVKVQINGNGGSTNVNLGDIAAKINNAGTIDLAPTVTLQVDDADDITSLGLSEISGSGNIDTGGNNDIDTTLDNNVIVNPAINDAPTAIADTANITENQSILIDVLANDTDANGDTLTLQNVTLNSDYGAVSIVDGKIQFDPGTDFDRLKGGENEQVDITYTVSDGKITTEGNLTISVDGVEDPTTGYIEITGTVAQGNTLTGNLRLSDPDGGDVTVLFQWQRDGVDIEHALFNVYNLTQDDVGHEITMKAWYSNSDGSGDPVELSATTGPVANINDDPTGSVSISGAATQGETLTASNNLADIDGLGTIDYQWQRDGINIANADGDSYLLTIDDVGHEISVVASYTDAYGTNESVSSLSTDTISEMPPTISINDVSVSEAAETATFTVTLSNPSASTVTVDYDAPDGSSGTLTFNPGETEKTFVTAWNDDSIEEADEVVNATLSNPSNATISDGTGQLTINDDDAPVYINGTAGNDEFTTTGNTEIFDTGEGDDTITVNIADNSIAEDTFNFGSGKNIIILNGDDPVTPVSINLSDINASNLDDIILSDGNAESLVVTPEAIASIAENRSLNPGDESYYFSISGHQEDSIELSDDFQFNGYSVFNEQTYQIYSYYSDNINITLNVSMEIGTITALNAPAASYTETTPNHWEATDPTQSAFSDSFSTEDLTITGNDGKDYISTGSGDDYIITGNGDGRVWSGAGDDTVIGGDGKNYIVGTEGSDTLDGGGGDNDTLQYVYSDAAVNVNLATGAASGGDAEGDTISNFEILYGSDFDDILTGSDKNESILGNAGDDIINAGGGHDILYGFLGTDTLNGGAGDDLFNLQSDDDNDIFDGGSGIDALRISNYDDGIRVATVSDYNISNIELFHLYRTELVIDAQDVINITDDNNTIYVRGTFSEEAITTNSAWTYTKDVVLNGQLYHSYTSGDATLNVSVDMTNLNGLVAPSSTFSETSTAVYSADSDADSYFYLGNGPSNPTINGKAGNDIIIGRGTINGGDGNDYLAGLGTTNILNGDAGDDTLLILEGMYSEDLDSFDGGEGEDTLLINGINNGLNFGFTGVLSSGAFNIDLSAVNAVNFEYITLQNDVNLTFSAQDVIDITGPNNALYINGSGEDSIQSIITSDDWTFLGYANLSNNTDGVLYLAYQSGDATIHIDMEIANWDGITKPAETFTETSPNVYDSASLNVENYFSDRNSSENLTVNGGNVWNYILTGKGDDTVNGGTAYDRIFTGAGNDTVNGGDGNDLINGGDGDDILNGGGGNDLIYGGKGDDHIVVIGTTTADQYDASAITNPGGSGVNLSSLISLDDLNGHLVSDAINGEIIDGGDGDNTLYIYGTTDLTGVSISNVTNLVVNSNVTFTATQISQFTNIDGDGNSVLNIVVPDDANNYTLDLTQINFTDIAEIHVNGDLTFIIDDANDFSGIQNISAEAGSEIKLDVTYHDPSYVITIDEVAAVFDQVIVLDYQGDGYFNLIVYNAESNFESDAASGFISELAQNNNYFDRLYLYGDQTGAQTFEVNLSSYDLTGVNNIYLSENGLEEITFTTQNIIDWDDSTSSLQSVNVYGYGDDIINTDVSNWEYSYASLPSSGIRYSYLVDNNHIQITLSPDLAESNGFTIPGGFIETSANVFEADNAADFPVLFQQYATENLTVTGSSGRNNTISTGSGDDYITLNTPVSLNQVYAGAGNDTIIGSDGRDIIRGNEGDDIILAGDGRDRVYGGDGADYMDGGAGLEDHVNYYLSPESVYVNLSTDVAYGGFADGDTILNFEEVYGSAFNDTLIGDDNNNSLYGGDGGFELIYGGGGDDKIYGLGILYGESGNDFYTLNQRESNKYEQITQFDGGADTDTVIFQADSFLNEPWILNSSSIELTNIENIIFNTNGSNSITSFSISAQDVIDTTDSNNVLYISFPRGVNSEYLNISTNDIWTYVGDVEYSYSDGRFDYTSYYNQYVSGGVTLNIDVYIEVQNGFPQPTTNFTETNPNEFDAPIGKFGYFRDSDNANDLTINAGDDQVKIESGNGNDIITIGNHADNYVYGGDGNDTITSGENTYDTLIFGGAGDDIIVGGSIIEGGAGADDMTGNTNGSSTLSYENSYSGVTVDLGAGTGSAGDAAGDTFSQFSAFTGSSHDDVVLMGGTFHYAETGAGNDTITGTNLTDTIYAGEGNDTVDGGDEVDYLYGESGDDVINGDDGDDYIDGGLGADIINGGLGTDTMIFDPADSYDGGLDNSYDMLQFIGSGYDINLADIDVVQISVIDIGGYGDNSLTVTAQDVLDVTEAQNQLLILGDTGDTVTSTGQGWVYQGDIVHIDGETLHYYFNGEANLYVDDDITQLIS